MVAGLLNYGAAAPRAFAADAGWTTYHLNNSRNANDAAEPAMGGPLVSQWSSQQLDGDIYAEPLIHSGLVFVATENNTVYALRETDGSIFWQHHLATPVSNSRLAPNCGNVDPVGITGTPVIDTARKVIYVVGLSDLGGGAMADVLYGLNIADGGLTISRPIDPPGLDPIYQNQRAALTLANGYVYAAWGGRIGDCTPYHPWVVGAPIGGGPLVQYQPQGTGQNGGGIWGPSGPAVDGAGNLFVVTGNGFTGGTAPCNGVAWDHGDGILRLDPSLAETDHFAPANWCYLNQADADLGSIGPMLLPDGRLFMTGKSGDGWLLNPANLGSTTQGSTGTHLGTCLSGDAVFGGMAADAGRIYVPCDGVGIVALDSAGLAVQWTASGSYGPPIVAGGYVWAVSQGGGSLHRFDRNGAEVGFGPSSVPGGTRFTTPSADSGRVFAAGARHVHEFNFANLTPPPTPPGGCLPGSRSTTGGYDILTAGGGIYTFGSACYYGNLIDHGYPGPAVGLATTPGDHGYSILNTGGGLYTFGDARYWGNLLDHGYPGPATALSMTPSGNGYAILTGFGGVYTFGDARYFGNLIDHGYPGTAVGLSYTPSGNGYAILTDSGALYTFGDARYWGNLLDHGYPGPAVSLSYTAAGKGYEILTESGALYTFGDGPYFGNLLDHGYPGPAVALGNTP